MSALGISLWMLWKDYLHWLRLLALAAFALLSPPLLWPTITSLLPLPLHGICSVTLLETLFEYSVLSAVLKNFYFFLWKHSSFHDCWYASLFLFTSHLSCLSFSAFGEPCVFSYLLNMGAFSSHLFLLF